MPRVPAEMCLSTRDLFEPRLGPGCVVHGVVEGGVAHLVLCPLPLGAGSPQRRADDPPIRAARSLGGGSWCWSSSFDAIAYVAADGDLWLQAAEGGRAQRLTHWGPERSLSGPVALADGRRLAVVVDLAEVWTVDTGSGAAARADTGSAGFVIDPVAWPAASQEGGVAWVGWSEPDMPWDRTALLDAAGTVLAGGAALQQPRIGADGSTWSIRDDTGWLNLWRNGQPFVDEPYEHAGPMWGPGQRTYALSPDGSAVVFARNENGFGRLCSAAVDSGGRPPVVRDVARAVHGQLDWHGSRVVAMRTGGRTPTQVVLYDAATWERESVAVGPDAAWLQSPWCDELVEPTLHEIPTDDGVVHARLYSTTGTARGLIVWLHGGPTDQWQVTFMPRLAYWCSRGWSVLVPDHRGSTGHGRDYQQALRGKWGILDVDDTIAATRWAQQRGLARPSTTVLMGGSAGGYTALRVIAAAPEVCAGAAVAYPVTDLADLAERSHRFERHYTDTLVGPLPTAADDYRHRSPAWHADRYVDHPLLVLHGDADAVVPVEQSRVFVERVRAAGGRARLHVYEGEGHGFRQRANQLDEFRRVEEFLDGIVGVAG
ncbi:MAG: hypothetical protein RLY45_197 [Actinomycetota bacterium]